MKAVFYPRTCKESALTIVDRMVYSQVLFRSLWDAGKETFEEGEFSITNYTDWSQGLVPLGYTITSCIATSLNISRAQYFLSCKRLREMGYITQEGVILLDGVTDSFFELHTESGLSGLSLIVYSYLVNKTREYGWVDKYHAAIAKELGIKDVRTLQRILADLKKSGLIQTKIKWRQTLLRAI